MGNQLQELNYHNSLSADSATSRWSARMDNVLLVARNVSNTTPSVTCWTNQAQYYTAYSQADLKPLATELSEMLQRKSAEGKKCEVNRKFRSEKLCSVSRNPICSHAKSHLKQCL